MRPQETPRTISTYFDHITSRHGPRPALLTRPRYRTEQWSYARLRAQADRVACALQAHGIRAGDRVVIWGPNSPWWVATYFGALRVGAVLVPLDMQCAPDYIGRVIEKTTPTMAILSHQCRPTWEYPAPVWYLEDLDTQLGPDATPRLPALSPDHLAEILYTSGTTGAPKGVVLTHGNLMANLAACTQVCPPYPDSRLLSLLPLSHMLEQMGGLLLPLNLGASIYYPASRSPSLLLRDLREQRITTFLGVPQIFTLFMQSIEQEAQRRGKKRAWRTLQHLAPALPPRLRRLIFRSVHRRLGGGFTFLLSGGAPLDTTLTRKWEALGVPMLQAYGTTEASPALTCTTLANRPPGSVGKPVPGVRLRIADDGEILVGGANITTGYWRDPEITAASFEKGWYRTGDLGHLDRDGNLYLRGRKKDLIVRPDGQNVYPEDVEQALLAVSGIEDVAVIDLPGAHGAQVHAVLRCTASAEEAVAMVRQANRRLAPHQQIQGYTLWTYGDFPRTHTMKIRKAEIARILSMGEAPGAQPARLASAMPVVIRLVTTITSWPPLALHATNTLGDLGIDSLGRAELLAAIEHECGVYLDETAIGPDTTIGVLEEMVRRDESGARPAPARWPLSRAAIRIRDACYRPAQAALDVFCPATVSGQGSLDGIPHPAIFVANHTSALDVPVMLRALGPYWRRRIALVTADKYFKNPVLGTSMALFCNSFRFVREGSIRPTLEHAAWLVDQRWSLILFPEGTRSATGEMAPFKAGIGMLAVELGVPVVPLHLAGVWEVLPRDRRVPRPGGVQVRIGAPLRFAPGTAYAQATQAIAAAIVHLAQPHPH